MEVNLDEIKEQIALYLLTDDARNLATNTVADKILSLIQPLLAKSDERIATLEAEVANLRAIEAQHKSLNGQLREALKGAKYAD